LHAQPLRPDEPRAWERYRPFCCRTRRPLQSVERSGRHPCALREKADRPCGVARKEFRNRGRGNGSDRDKSPLEHPLAIMASAAMKPFAVRARTDAGGVRLHGKADIYMAETAGELGAVKPMIKYDGTGPSRGVIVKNHLAILRRFRWRFGQIDLG